MHCSSRTCAQHTTQHTTASRFQRQHKNLPVPAPARRRLVAPPSATSHAGSQGHPPIHRYSAPPDTQTKLVKAASTLNSSHSAALWPPHSREERLRHPLKQGI